MILLALAIHVDNINNSFIHLNCHDYITIVILLFPPTRLNV